ncbi:nucleotide sugar dehydrogenase [Amycolatopsis albispora]|uniref:UDP-N-acetyl-D-glucosamine dehydrogenase n=1 Tax=Amycolatopsis albispora TaxID=1804986 RepID=A0A344LMA9_9PSEU|nr:nucleotide sugar dehydrogenase [Amycolatopsis albispora]AXB49183.1 UDP-N-acetyl-D-glucosamine dehydrogenase [Amycolatopsis albispora]
MGLGYVGLPLARLGCRTGLPTRGFDLAEPVVTSLNAGRSPVHGVSDDDLAEMRAAGFTATTGTAVLADADTVVICVPTGLTPQGKPDLRAVRSAAEILSARLRPGTLVVLESTSFPGTTEEVVRPILENGSGLVAGEDFHLVYSPERIDPGNPRFDISNTPKVIGGYTPLCAKHGAAFYGELVDTVVIARGTREAEMSKLLENTYRFVNIALVNEIAVFCDRMGIDVWDVLECAATKPFGFAPFRPGPGIGGHCIPVDPLYLTSKAQREGFSFSLVSAARQINDGMPEYVARRAAAILADRGGRLAGAEVLLLGVTYKPDVPDVRESPAIAVAEAFAERGAKLRYHDPHIERFEVDGVALDRVTDLPAALADAELTVLLQDHACYESALLAREARCLLDTRGRVAGHRVRLL